MEALIHAAQILLSTLTVASIVYHVVCVFAARRFFSRPEPFVVSSLPPVSVMIPLCGADFKAYGNYASFCRQKYPEFQIVFGVQDPEDSSIAVVRKLMADFPERDIELVVGSKTIGENPKVNNLYNMLESARHEILVLSDSDIRVGPDFLAQSAPRLLDDRVGLVSCFYRAGEAPNFASKLEAVGITGEFALGVLTAHLLEGMTFALGATMVTTKRKLESIGGFRAVADYLADDYMLGNLMWKAGYEVKLLPLVVETMLPPVSLPHMIRHQIRWARGIRACRKAGHFGSIVTHGAPLALLNLIACGCSPASVILLVLALSARVTAASRVGVGYLKDRVLERNMRLLPLRDLLSFIVWCSSLWGRKVEWRGKIYEIVESGKIRPYPGENAHPHR